MTPNQPSPTGLALSQEMKKLIQQAEAGDLSVLPALRKLLDDSPALWQYYGDLAAVAERTWLDLIAGDNLVFKESLSRKMEELKAELADRKGPPLERLLADRVAVCWLQLAYADARFASLKAGQSFPEQVRLAQQFLDRAQHRYLAAIKQLALVRKLLRPLPSPIDIATRMTAGQPSQAPSRRPARASQKAVALLN